MGIAATERVGSAGVHLLGGAVRKRGDVGCGVGGVGSRVSGRGEGVCFYRGQLMISNRLV